jgi:hypothetical protein
MHRARAIGVSLPLDPAEVAMAVDDPTDAWDAFVRGGRRIERRVRSGATERRSDHRAGAAAAGHRVGGRPDAMSMSGASL